MDKVEIKKIKLELPSREPERLPFVLGGLYRRNTGDFVGYVYLLVKTGHSTYALAGLSDTSGYWSSGSEADVTSVIVRGGFDFLGKLEV